MNIQAQCPNSPGVDGYPHDFRAEGSGFTGGQPVIYCTRCGEIRPLEVERTVSGIAPLPPPNLRTGVGRIG